MSARLARFPAALVLALALVLVPGPVAAGAAAAAPAPGGPVVASSLRWVITLQGGAPVVLELVTLVNTGSEATSAWSWQLPAGAREAALQTGGGTARLSGGRLTDTRGLAPGEQRSYAVRYRLPWTVPGEFRLRPSLPVGAVAALVDEGSVRLSGPGWVRLGVVSTAGRALRQYALDEPLAPGQTVRFTLTPPDWWYEHGTGFLAGVWVALLAGVPALALWLWRRTRPERELERVRRALEQVERLRTEGRLAEDRYRLRRQQLVDEAAELWPKVGGGPRRAGERRMTLLEARELALRLGDRLILRRVDFVLEAGELALLQGPNGAGKTSLLRLLAGMERPSAGQLLWRGRPVRQWGPAYRGGLAWVGHRTGLYPRLTGRESLLLQAAGYPWLSAEEAGRRAEAWLARAGLLRWADRPVSHYSQGMRQRLAIARSFLPEPQLILLDEAAGGLDAEGRRFLRLALDEARGRGAAAVLVSHEAEPGLGEVDRRWWLEAGRLRVETVGRAAGERNGAPAPMPGRWPR